MIPPTTLTMTAMNLPFPTRPQYHRRRIPVHQGHPPPEPPLPRILDRPHSLGVTTTRCTIRWRTRERRQPIPRISFGFGLNTHRLRTPPLPLPYRKHRLVPCLLLLVLLPRQRLIVVVVSLDVDVNVKSPYIDPGTDLQPHACIHHHPRFACLDNPIAGENLRLRKPPPCPIPNPTPPPPQDETDEEDDEVFSFGSRGGGRAKKKGWTRNYYPRCQWILQERSKFVENTEAKRYRKMMGGGGKPPSLQPSRWRGVRSSQPDTMGQRRLNPQTISIYLSGGGLGRIRTEGTGGASAATEVAALFNLRTA